MAGVLMRAVISALVFILSTVCAYPSNQPQIGILLQDSFLPGFCEGQYLSTQYKSFVEQGGGGAVPIFLNQPDEYYEKLIPKLNGVLLTGGGLLNIVSSTFANTTFKIYNMALEMNDDGIYFPIWGTCQGFEEMTTWPLSQKHNLLTNCSGTEGVSLPLNFTDKAKTSRLFSLMPHSLLAVLSKENITPNSHYLCLSAKSYNTSNQLHQFYNMLSTNVDKKGLEFISTFESIKYPFYGVQWHPEKIVYDHSTTSHLDKSFEAIMVGQYFSNFFIQEARKNKNRFSSLEQEGRFMLNRYNSKFLSDWFIELYCLHLWDVPTF